jgi:hypothetical protein
LISDDELKKRFIYHHSSRSQSDSLNTVALFYYSFAKILTDHCPDGREMAMLLTKLEESEQWAFASVMRNDIVEEPEDDIVEIAGVGKVKKKGKEK